MKSRYFSVETTDAKNWDKPFQLALNDVKRQYSLYFNFPKVKNLHTRQPISSLIILRIRQKAGGLSPF